MVCGVPGLTALTAAAAARRCLISENTKYPNPIGARIPNAIH
ncbi:Uncharacterised protein [Mycobacteroides abscessus subsp. abscessus]|nr:Uncharacterised protein [Mycobacteroides abscessus subsp. abscessus]